MEQLVESLADLPPYLIYATVAFATLVENVLPPMPSDLAVALGGFLSQRGILSPAGLWLAAWLPNMAGALGVYLLARRFGRDFLASRLGRRLIPADALLGVEREYLRFGLAGIFFSRLLPGFRSIVAPFVGLVNLPPWAVLTPMGVAAALWYWALIWAGAKVGAEWDEIRSFVGRLNLTMAVIATTATLALAIWVWRRATREAPQRRRLLAAIRRAIVPGAGGSPSAADVDLASQAAAALFHELARSDPEIPREQREAIAAGLRDRWRLGEPREEDTEVEARGGGSGGTAAATAFARDDRIAVAERLYRVARGDGVLSLHEERIMRRAGDLMGLTAEDLAEARRRSAG
ncbi:MAG: VTT domain-containing protein [Gemmatimonadota bacterium]|nr:VTT domain-containing protein [Gemmatimonadota bacterium]